MKHMLSPLDARFLDILGCQGTQEQFKQHLARQEPPEQDQAQSEADSATEPPPFRWQPDVLAGQYTGVGQGVQLTLQCLEPDAPPDQAQWGLRSLTLHSSISALGADAWEQAWPADLPADKSTLHDVCAAFGEPEVRVPGLVIFALDDPENRVQGLQCQFDAAGHLQTLTMVHLGQWLPFPEKVEPAANVLPAPQ